MSNTIKLDGSGRLHELYSCCTDPPEREWIKEHLEEKVFPLLDMDHWIEVLIRSIPEGNITTFGYIARALGTIKASRAVGERIAKGMIDAPTHRVIYSDGRIPEASIEQLSMEIDISGIVREGGNPIIDLAIDHPPLTSLILLQERMASWRTDKGKKISSVAGMDISSKDDCSAGSISIMELNGEEKGSISISGKDRFPFVPGLLFFREAPLMMKLIETASSRGMIDDETLIAIDGNGILHPRRSGIATQIGIACGRMTCGIAKRLMMGEPSAEIIHSNGKRTSDIMDNDEMIGRSLIREGCRPVYLSVGNGCTMDRIMPMIEGLWWKRVPEPTRRAHELANRARKASPSG